MTARNALAVLVCVGSVAGCWPGRCTGGVRAVGPLSLNLDTNLQTAAEILAASEISDRSVLLEGPTGMVPLSVEAFVSRSAHSCASGGSVRATPATPLTPGDYTFIVLMDQVKWPAINGGDVTSWQGHPAIVHKYRVP